MKNFIQEGNVITLIAPAGGVIAGNVVIVGTLYAVATTTVAVGEEFEGVVGGGVYEFTKTTADTPTQGGAAYWDDTAKEVTTTSTANTLIGVFANAYLNGDTLAHVRVSAN